MNNAKELLKKWSRRAYLSHTWVMVRVLCCWGVWHQCRRLLANGVTIFIKARNKLVVCKYICAFKSIDTVLEHLYWGFMVSLVIALRCSVAHIEYLLWFKNAYQSDTWHSFFYRYQRRARFQRHSKFAWSSQCSWITRSISRICHDILRTSCSCHDNRSRRKHT